MKSRNVLRATALVALVPALAFAAAYLKFDGIDGECAKSEEALNDIKAAGSDPQPIGLLLPAVQKVREAASRMQEKCAGRAGLDADCAAKDLSAAIVASDDKNDPALSLLDLYAEGTATTPKRALAAARKAGAGGDGAQRTEDLLGGILAGLAREMLAAKMPAPVTDPIQAAVAKASRIAP